MRLRRVYQAITALTWLHWRSPTERERVRPSAMEKEDLLSEALGVVAVINPVVDLGSPPSVEPPTLHISMTFKAESLRFVTAIADRAAGITNRGSNECPTPSGSMDGSVSFDSGRSSGSVMDTSEGDRLSVAIVTEMLTGESCAVLAPPSCLIKKSFR